MPVTEACNSHVPSYKPRQQVIQFPQSPPVFNPAFPLTHTSLLYSALHSKSFRDSLVLLFHFLYTEDKLWLPNSHGLMTILQNNPKLQGHPNLFWKHYSLEDFFTHMFVYKPPSSTADIWTSTVPGHQACSELCVSSFLVQGIVQGKDHDPSSVSNLRVSSKNLCACLTDIITLFCSNELILSNKQH